MTRPRLTDKLARELPAPRHAGPHLRNATPLGGHGRDGEAGKGRWLRRRTRCRLATKRSCSGCSSAIPGLTREKIIEQARVWGWDLDLGQPPSPGPPKPSRGALNHPARGPGVAVSEIFRGGGFLGRNE
jgi:hypothetical protein